MKVSVYIATSLDGFITRKDGKLDWLDEANSVVPEGEDCGFQAFMNSVGILIMGRKTFEQVLSFGQWLYGKTHVIVLSGNPMTIPAGLPDTVTHSSEQPRPLLKGLSNKGIKHVYIDGGALKKIPLGDLFIRQRVADGTLLVFQRPRFGDLCTGIIIAHT